VKLNGVMNVLAFKRAVGDKTETRKLFRGEGVADSSLCLPPTGKDLGQETADVVRGDE
jgi:hypothetical protein